MSSRQLEEIQEGQRDKKLASLLGIDYEELAELTWDIDTNESNDGLIYEYLVIFHDRSPQEILGKIENLENGNCVRLQPSDLDE